MAGGSEVSRLCFRSNSTRLVKSSTGAGGAVSEFSFIHKYLRQSKPRVERTTRTRDHDVAAKGEASYVIVRVQWR